jgi:hypothetical protein
MEVLPLVMNEHQGNFFKFWFEDKLNDGLRLRNGLFRHVQTFGAAHRDQAYALAYAMGQQRIQTVITCSKTCYKVWIDLKVPNQPRTASEKKSLAIASSAMASIS